MIANHVGSSRDEGLVRAQLHDQLTLADSISLFWDHQLTRIAGPAGVFVSHGTDLDIP